jgi:hypothetical protein
VLLTRARRNASVLRRSLNLIVTRPRQARERSTFAGGISVPRTLNLSGRTWSHRGLTRELKTGNARAVEGASVVNVRSFPSAVPFALVATTR